MKLEERWYTRAHRHNSRDSAPFLFFLVFQNGKGGKENMQDKPLLISMQKAELFQSRIVGYKFNILEPFTNPNLQGGAIWQLDQYLMECVSLFSDCDLTFKAGFLFYPLLFFAVLEPFETSQWHEKKLHWNQHWTPVYSKLTRRRPRRTEQCES